MLRGKRCHVIVKQVDREPEYLPGTIACVEILGSNQFCPEGSAIVLMDTGFLRTVSVKDIRVVMDDAGG